MTISVADSVIAVKVTDGGLASDISVNGGASTDATRLAALPTIQSPCVVQSWGFSASSALRIGMDRTYAGRAWLGRIGEVVVFSSTLTAAHAIATHGNFAISSWVGAFVFAGVYAARYRFMLSDPFTGFRVYRRSAIDGDARRALLSATTAAEQGATRPGSEAPSEPCSALLGSTRP